MSKVLLAIVLTMATLTACGSEGVMTTADGAALPIRAQQGSSGIPTGSLPLMVAYSDLIMEFTILSEAEGESERLEGAPFVRIKRLLTMEVDSVLWSSPVDPNGWTPRVGDKLVVPHAGWVVNDEGQVFRTVDDGKELVVGSSYFGAFDFNKFGPDGLSFGTSAALYLSDGRAPIVLSFDSYPSFAGTPTGELAKQLQTVSERPDVAIFAGKSGRERQELYTDSLDQ